MHHNAECLDKDEFVPIEVPQAISLANYRKFLDLTIHYRNELLISFFLSFLYNMIEAGRA